MFAAVSRLKLRRDQQEMIVGLVKQGPRENAVEVLQACLDVGLNMLDFDRAVKAHYQGRSGREDRGGGAS